MKTNVCIQAILIALLFFSSIAYSTSIKEEVSPLVEKHIQFLTATNCLETHKITLSGIHFNHIILIECLHEIEKQQSFTPLIGCWKKLKKMPELDANLIGQFSIILLLAYHVSLGCHTEQNRLAWLSLISLYAQLNMIPLKKLFEALDECLQQYQVILDSFPREKNESWDVWLQKNWLVPIAVISFTLYSFIHWRYASSSYPVK